MRGKDSDEQTLHRMLQDEQLMRLHRGRYAASRDALQGVFDDVGYSGNIR